MKAQRTLYVVKAIGLATVLGALFSSLVAAAPYTVQAKDTLYGIAKRFNVPVEVLMRVNQLKTPDLKLGQILEIPERQHTVIKGDTLFNIAKRYATTIEALTNLNQLGSSGLKLGQILLIPWDATLFVTPKPSTSTAATAQPNAPTVAATAPSLPAPPSSSSPPAPKPSNPVSSSSTQAPALLPAPVADSRWHNSPSDVVPQMPIPERPKSTFPTDPSSARTKIWTLLTSAPLPILTTNPPPPNPDPPPAPPVSSSDPSLSYTVQAGDTLFSIAKRFGLTVDLLLKTNNLSSSNLQIGQVLQIPQANLVENKSLRDISERYLGVNYVFGGSSASGLDCSGFTSLVFKEFGITLPRVSREQFLVGTAVEKTDLREGDLVFFDTTGKGVSHVGIYLDNDEFIHAASNPGRVIKSKLTEKYYADRYLGARRVIQAD